MDGLGLNRQELLKNPVLNFFEVRDLNQNCTLPYPDTVFDAVSCALSFQYMQYPEQLVLEIARVLKPGGVCVVSFSNRMFSSKAIYGFPTILYPHIFRFSTQQLSAHQYKIGCFNVLHLSASQNDSSTAGWRKRSDRQRLSLVEDYFRSCPAFPDPRGLDRSTLLHTLSYLTAVNFGVALCGDPFFAVVVRKQL